VGVNHFRKCQSIRRETGLATQPLRGRRCKAGHVSIDTARNRTCDSPARPRSSKQWQCQSIRREIGLATGSPTLTRVMASPQCQSIRRETALATPYLYVVAEVEVRAVSARGPETVHVTKPDSRTLNLLPSQTNSKCQSVRRETGLATRLSSVGSVIGSNRVNRYGAQQDLRPTAGLRNTTSSLMVSIDTARNRTCDSVPVSGGGGRG